MDIVKIQCPSCGASVERKNDEYFGVCPYCGSEVCFNDARAEAEVNDLRGQLNSLDQRLDEEKMYKQQLAVWEKKRSRMYIITGIMAFLGFLFVTLSEDSEGALIAIGVMLLFGAVIGLIFFSILRAADCPKPNNGGGAQSTINFFKIFGIGVLILCGAAFLSIIFYCMLGKR